jgi:3-methyladenine DNA glycosylase AlkD
MPPRAAHAAPVVLLCIAAAAAVAAGQDRFRGGVDLVSLNITVTEGTRYVTDRMAATVLLDARSGLLVVDDLALLERLLRDSHTWALVDSLAGDVVGSLLAADEERTSRVLDRWARDDDFWIRRSALLAWLKPLRRGASLDRFLTYADSMLEEKEFFIRKAVGWVLREVSKRRPSEVIDWLAPRTHRASGVTMREATKYLPKPDGERLTRAYREGRQANPG